MGTFTLSGTQTIIKTIRGFFIQHPFSLLSAHCFLCFSQMLRMFLTTWHEILLVFLLYVQSHELLRNIFILTCEVCTIFIMLVLASLALNKSCVATRLMAGLLSKLDFFFCRIERSWVAGANVPQTSIFRRDRTRFSGLPRDSCVLGLPQEHAQKTWEASETDTLKSCQKKSLAFN